MSASSGYGHDNGDYVRPWGSADDGEFHVAVTPTATNPVPGWQHTRLRVATLAPGGHVVHDSGDEETLVVPLVGSFHVEVTEADGTTHDVVLAGRTSVFDGPTDIVYAGRGSTLRVTLEGPDAGRVALCGAPATKAAEPKAFRHLTAPEVPVELRGAGRASREVRNMGLPDVLDADSFLVCEVITPAGNWSSWPPHKHDEERPGEVVLVPHGWHGPAIASPDADLYYLNVMAGPGPERAWRICDDPAHAWVRDTWADDDVDPRLPVGGTR